MKPLLLFDMDGTLIALKHMPKYKGTTTHHTPYMSIKEQMKRVAASNGVPMELVKDMTRMAHIWNAVRGYWEERLIREEVEELMEKINEPFMVEERSEHDLSVLLPDTIPALTELESQGYELGLVTTASRWSYDRLSKSPEFGEFGRFFELSITRDEVDYIKPNPEPLNRMMKITGRSDVVYIGDADHDGMAAEAAGAKFVLINTRGYDEETVNALKPDGVIEKLTELPGLLATLRFPDEITRS